VLAQVGRCAQFGGLELIDPGVALVAERCPQGSSGPRPSDPDVNWYGGIGHKPL
jgi:hypothetical protein